MLWNAIGYRFWSSLVHIGGTLNSTRYISGVLRPVALSFIRPLRNPMFKQGNTRPHVALIVRTFLDAKNVRLLPWMARSPDLSSIENVWSMVDERLARHNTPVTTVDELWHSAKAAWASLHLYIPSTLCLMPRQKSAVITARGS
ncbi:transposable element Tcb1 transposase [Trichonephila clavipes]|nr:transposable element Tcb1 transposase [Trichonephila clavipes]